MNTDTLWKQIENSKPSLQPHVSVIPLTFRGSRWYLLKNDVTGEFSRLNGEAYHFVARLDGIDTLDEIYTQNCLLQDDALEKEEIISLINLLLSTDFVKLDEPLNPKQQTLLQDYRNERNKLAWVTNPLALKFNLLNPNRYLDRFNAVSKNLITQQAFIIWIAVVLLGAFTTTYQFGAITAEVNSDLLRPSNLVLMLCVFVVIKLIHELAHAFAIKHWGGDVKEMGITFLVFSPVPYVDATASWAFQDKLKRIVVSAMGILAEIFIASLAIVVWSLAEPGTIKDLALSSAIVASASTLLFNANPLLKFDGYYVLQDAIEIPNLHQRSKQYLTYLIGRYIVGLQDVHYPVYEKSERSWLAFYGIFSLAYRIFLLTIIVFYLIQSLLFLGVVITFWAIFNQLIKPCLTGFHYLLKHTQQGSDRTRCLSRASTALFVCCLTLVILPLPNTTYAEGAIWIKDQSQIYSNQSGYIEKIWVTSGDFVTEDQILLELRAPQLEAQIRKLEAKQRELNVQAQTDFVKSNGRSPISKELLKTVGLELQQLYQKQSALTVRAKNSGQFFSPELSYNQGKHLQRGEFIGYVFSPDSLIVQAIFPQSQIGKIRKNVKSVNVKLAENIDIELPATISRETPSSTSKLPSKALGASNGGKIVVKVEDDSEVIASEDHFQIDFSLQTERLIPRIGGIVYIRINHAAQPFSYQAIGAIKNAVMNRLAIS